MSYDRRLVTLERKQARQSAFDVPGRWYELLVSPSCPPDRRVHIRGGAATPSPYWGWIMNSDFIPDTICDFDRVDETGLTLAFTNANYFLPIILCYYYEWVAGRTSDPPYFSCVVGTEVATAIEAEAQIDAWLNGYTQWYQETMPLFGMVLKNNGAIDIQSAILPVDAVNRGRSYLYRDARMRLDISG